MKLTASESSWLGIFGILSVIVLVYFFMRPQIFLHADEPLADPASLRTLVSGEEVASPMDEPTAVFHGVPSRPPTLASLSDIRRVLGLSWTNENKRIEVDLARQRVYAYEGDTKVFEFIVSTGKWALTPTGVFAIWAKVRSQKMSGGDPKIGTYYYLPNVPYVMFFYNDDVPKMKGFSFHGTYWHDNFGHPMSHGCVNMKTADAEELYQWADPQVTNPKAWSTLASADNTGTKVFIYGEAPAE